MTGRKPLLLVLDYPGRRTESRVSDLALEQAGCDVRYLLTAPFVRQVTAAAYATELLARGDAVGGEVAAVVAYCMAAPIAQEVAARCTGAAPVPLLLFDGEPCSPAALDDQYGASLAQISNGAEVAAQPFDGRELAHRPDAVVARMRRGLVDAALPALLAADDGDLDPEEAAETAAALAEFYLDWLVQLVAAHNASWPRWRGEVCHVASRDHTFTGDWPGAATTRVQRVDSARDDLMRHPGARRLALSFLGLPTD
jgi:hypothetical protein